MDSWITGLIVATIQTIVTTIIGLVINNKWNKQKKEKTEFEKLKEERRIQEEVNRAETVKLAVQQEIEKLDEKVSNQFNQLRSDFNAEIKPINEDLSTLKTAMQKDIRRSIRQDGKLLNDRGWATQQEKTEFDELYWAYHNLGKNGVVDALHDQVMHLPEKRPYQSKQSRKNTKVLNQDKN